MLDLLGRIPPFFTVFLLADQVQTQDEKAWYILYGVYCMGFNVRNRLLRKTAFLAYQLNARCEKERSSFQEVVKSEIRCC